MLFKVFVAEGCCTAWLCMPNCGCCEVQVGKAATLSAENDKQLEESQVGVQQLTGFALWW